MKRTLALCCLILWMGAAASAQSPSPATPSAPDLEVVKYSWAKERVNWESDPFSGPIENFDDIRRRLADQRRVERARGAAPTAESAKVEREMRSEQVIKARSSAPPRYAFHYKISIKNSARKAIKEIDWDYVFSDAVTGQEVGRREFTGVEKIAPGKSRELSFMTPAAPTQRISAQALDKKERAGLNEQVVIVRVLYDDGTVWTRQ